MELGECIYKAAVGHVDKEVKTAKEVCNQDRLFNVCNDKHPTESASKAKLEGEGAGTVCCDWGTTDCLQMQ